MHNKYTQIFVCSIGAGGAKHYLAIGTTKLEKQDLESAFSEAPTTKILHALDGMKPAMLVWVELEQVAENKFSAACWSVSGKGVQQERCSMSGRDMRIGELADILVDECRRDFV